MDQTGVPGGAGADQHGVRPKAEVGAAALERVIAAAKAAHDEQQRSTEDQRAVCDLCNVKRADLRGPCGHKYHAREYERSNRSLLQTDTNGITAVLYVC